MREKAGKFKKAPRRKAVVLNKSDKAWLTKNTHFDPDNISEWFKVRGEFSLVQSHWSSNVQAWLSLVESFNVLKYLHGVATPALLCHKEPAQGLQNTPFVFCAFR